MKKNRFGKRDGSGEYITYAKTKKGRKRFFGAVCNKNIILIKRQGNRRRRKKIMIKKNCGHRMS